MKNTTVFIETGETLKVEPSAPLTEKQIEKLKEYKKRAIDQNASIVTTSRDAYDNLYLYVKLSNGMFTGVRIAVNGMVAQEYPQKEDREYFTDVIKHKEDDQ